MRVYVKYQNKNINNHAVRYATNWFAHMLMSPKLCDNLTIHIVNQIDSNNCGDIEDHYNENKLPRTFTIRINPNLSKKKYFLTLAHEMSHVKQYALGELRDLVTKTRWRGESYDIDHDYYDSPWEIDAYGREIGLYERFLQHIKKYHIIFNKPVKFYKKRVRV